MMYRYTDKNKIAGEKPGKSNLIYEDLSYEIIGSLFEVWNEVGPGHKEKIYQKALAKELENRGLKFKEQLASQLKYKGKLIGRYYFDFLIEDKFVLELKVRNYFSKNDIEQLFSYLKAKQLKLGMIAHFTKSGVKFKRVVNLN